MYVAKVSYLSYIHHNIKCITIIFQNNFDNEDLIPHLTLLYPLAIRVRNKPCMIVKILMTNKYNGHEYCSILAHVSSYDHDENHYNEKGIST